MLGSTYGFFGGVSGGAEGNARVLTLTVRPASMVAGLAVALLTALSWGTAQDTADKTVPGD